MRAIFWNAMAGIKTIDRHLSESEFCFHCTVLVRPTHTRDFDHCTFSVSDGFASARYEHYRKHHTLVNNYNMYCTCVRSFREYKELKFVGNMTERTGYVLRGLKHLSSCQKKHPVNPSEHSDTLYSVVQDMMFRERNDRHPHIPRPSFHHNVL
jgi:hypothetical protein